MLAYRRHPAAGYSPGGRSGTRPLGRSAARPLGRSVSPAPGRWLGLSLVQTAPMARRRGLGRHLTRAVAQWALQRGAVRAYLQVEERNTAAVGLYQGLGFSTHHTYLTREAPR